MRIIAIFGILLLLLVGIAMPAEAPPHLTPYIIKPPSIPVPPLTTLDSTEAFRYLETIVNLTQQARVDIEVSHIGKSQRGHPILLVEIERDSQIRQRKKKVFVVARQHGDEPAGTHAALNLIRKCAQEDATYLRLLGKIQLYVIPIANPDGADKMKRMTAHGLNMNRDWHAQRMPETKAIATAIENVNPHMVFDLHEQTPRLPGKPYIAAAPYSRATDVTNRMVENLNKNGYSIRIKKPRGPQNDPLLHQWIGESEERIGILIESSYRSSPTKNLQRRSDQHLIAILAALQFISGKNK